MFLFGFVAMMVFTGLVFLAGFIFLSVDRRPQRSDKPVPYVTVRDVDTHTIETVDAAGVTRRWILPGRS
jgi:hypothetical protein